MSVKLTDVIGEVYYNCHWDIIEKKHTYYDLYGGRGSLKSSFASVEIVLGMMEDPDANAVVYRKYGSRSGMNMTAWKKYDPCSSLFFVAVNIM